MRSIDSCYFCATPYQIITAISIVQQRGETADLYVINGFSGASECANRVREEKIFSEVKLVEYLTSPKKNKLYTWIWATFIYVKYKRIARETLIENTEYDRIYASGNERVFRCSYFYLLEKHSNLKRINIDDGIGSYLNDRFITSSKKDEFIQRIIFGNEVLRPVYCQMLYCPSLYYLIHGQVSRKIEKIDTNFKNIDVISCYNRIFQFKYNNKITQKIIILDCLKNNIYTEQGVSQIYKIYKRMFQILETDDIIIKRHPRDTTNKIGGVNYYDDDQIPFECICMNMDCNDKVLISVCSTAVITPKILLNQEPIILLLYKLVEFKNQTTDDLDHTFQCCKQLYSNQERFMIPKTFEELNDCLNFILNNSVYQ